LKALVVDDSRVIRTILKRTLTAIGFEVKEAADGALALTEIADSGPFDLAVVDWNMPNMTGIELVAAVRGRSELDRMLIMMVTSESEVSQVERALAAGADEYLMKPFTDEALREKLVLLGLVAS
jgi:two-component system chemotaxis response regulator CheY